MFFQIDQTQYMSLKMLLFVMSVSPVALALALMLSLSLVPMLRLLGKELL